MALARQIAILTLLFTVTGASAARADVPVVATIKPIHSLAAAVMAGAGSPALLIDGAGSPHTFALKPSDARALQSARVVLRVSDRLEVFLNRVVKSLPSTTIVVAMDTAPGIKLLSMRSAGTFESHTHGPRKAGSHSAKHDHDHGEEGIDAHMWLDPENAKAIAHYIAHTLAAADPDKAARYRSNAAQLATRLDALSTELARDVASVGDKPFVVFHDAYQYFERRFGLAAIGSVTISPDNAPSAKRLTALRRKITQLKAQCIFAEPQFEPKLVATVAEGTGARVGTLDPLGAAIPSGPELYEMLMRSLASSLRSCLLPPS